MLRPIAVLLAAFVVLAGCTSSTDSPPATASTTAAAPAANETAGSITGSVVDEERLPILGVRIAILESNLETETDASGAYTFNGVPGGTHQVIFERLGYEAVAKKVDVAVGEVTTLDIVLKGLLLDEEPYQAIDERTFYFNFAWYYISRAVPIVNQSAINEQTCSSCVFHIPFQPGAKAILTETLWQRSVAQPGVNENIEPFYCINWEVSCTVDGSLVDRKDMSSREQFHWSEAGVKAVAKLDLVRLEVLAGFPGIMFQQKGQIWTSFAYVDGFPDDFTAMPPE